MPMASTGDPAVILDPDQQKCGASSSAVGQTDHCLDQLSIVEGSSLLALELDGERLAASDEIS